MLSHSRHALRSAVPNGSAGFGRQGGCPSSGHSLPSTQTPPLSGFATQNVGYGTQGTQGGYGSASQQFAAPYSQVRPCSCI